MSTLVYRFYVDVSVEVSHEKVAHAQMPLEWPVILWTLRNFNRQPTSADFEVSKPHQHSVAAVSSPVPPNTPAPRLKTLRGHDKGLFVYQAPELKKLRAPVGTSSLSRHRSTAVDPCSVTCRDGVRRVTGVTGASRRHASRGDGGGAAAVTRVSWAAASDGVSRLETQVIHRVCPAPGRCPRWDLANQVRRRVSAEGWLIVGGDGKMGGCLLAMYHTTDVKSFVWGCYLTTL